MKPATTLLAAAAFAATAVWSKTISVDVGESGLVYSPDTITADVGDTVEFKFYPISHSVTQSAFSTPCQPLAGGINSGLVPVAQGQSSAQVFKVTIKDTNPIWFYCAQVQHCQLGMAGVINPGSGSLAAYKAAAKGAQTGQAGGVSGGSFGSPGGNEAAPAASSAAAAPAASSAAVVAPPPPPSSSAAPPPVTTTVAVGTTTAAVVKAGTSTTTAAVVVVVAPTTAAAAPAGNTTVTNATVTTGAPLASTGGAVAAHGAVGWGVLAVGLLGALVV